MPTEEHVALECPYCQGGIYQQLTWFKHPYFTCPACGGGLTANQFAAIVDKLEQAFEETITEMVQGKRGCNCNCGCNKTAD